jgi:hypothetical protein
MGDATLIVTIAPGKVASDLAFFPVLINMTDLPDAFWDIVGTTGSDLRAKSMNGKTKYPIDLLDIDTVAKTGHMFVRVPVLAAGNQFRIDYGDASLSPPPDDSPISHFKVWNGFGPVWCGLGQTDVWNCWRKQTNWRRVIYNPVAMVSGEISLTGGFLRAGSQYPANYSQRSVGVIGKRTAGAYEAALWSNAGSIDTDVDRETIYLRGDHTFALWNNSDGYMTGGHWAANTRFSVGFSHDDNVERKLYANGDLLATDATTFWLPSGGNYKFLGAENNEANQPLTSKIQFAYMTRSILPADWYAFEYENWFNPGTTLSYVVVDNIKVLDMSIIFAGTSVADVQTAGTIDTENDPGYVDTYCAESIRAAGSGSSNWFFMDIAPQNSLWIGYYQKMIVNANGNSVLPFVQFFNTAYSTANALLQIDVDDPSTINLEYWNGSAFVTDASIDPNMLNSTKKRIDIHIVLSDTVGKFELYIDGTLTATLTTSDTIRTAATTIDRITLRSPNVDTISCYYSGIIVADEDTRGMRLVQRLPTGAGAETDWTGAYTAIDEIGINDADFITSATANQTSTFTFNDLPSEFNGSPIAAVVVSERVQGSAISPTTLQNVARVGSTDYPDDTEHATTTAYGPAQTVFNVNPATLTEWTASTVNAAEFGVKSKT